LTGLEDAACYSEPQVSLNSQNYSKLNSTSIESNWKMDVGTFILLADPQLGGSGGVGDIKQLSDLNDSLNNISSQTYPDGKGLTCHGAPVGVPKGVFIAGDLTQDGGGKYGTEQVDIFGKNPANYLGGDSLSNVRKLYDPWHPENGITQLTKCGNIYFGLGNHGLCFYIQEFFCEMGDLLRPVD